jgi:hypothetical protein
VLDRFYPPAPFGLGKVQAHWLVDEAGAILVAAQLGVERKKLGSTTGAPIPNSRTDWKPTASSPT